MILKKNVPILSPVLLKPLAKGRAFSFSPFLERTPMKYLTMIALIFVGISSEMSVQAQDVFSDSGQSASDISDTVDAFRAALGDLNPFEPVNFGSGRRQINWDAAPDSISAPNNFPGDFFNFNASPRARGIEFSTPGSGFQLSATAASGQGADFTNINSAYDGTFEAFSPERLFTPINSNITDVLFFDPADQTTSAATNGFGVVFSDVDLQNTTSIELFDRQDDSLGVFYADTYVGLADDEHFSFLGISYTDSIISRARITTGTDALGGLEDPSNNIDLVVMDDIIFGEPSAVPEPGCLGVLLVGAVACGFRRRR